MEKIQLLEKLECMRIEPDGARLTFVARLAQENDWSLVYANRVMQEYRRFLFLAATCGHPTTPSDEVDQAWHLHLTYSRHYWETLCGEILKRPLHHGPTAGGESEGKRYRDQYQRTLEAYAEAFGEEPPADIWPDGKRRFGIEYRRVAVGQHWMVPKKAVYAAPLLTLAACTPTEWAAAGIIMVFVLLFGTIGLSAIYTDPGADKEKNKDGGGGCGSFTSGSGGSDDCGGGSSGCGGGCGS
jgi:hypothetical protein